MLELIFEVLPEQKIKSIQEMLEELGKRVEAIEPTMLRRNLMEPVFVDLFASICRAPSSPFLVICRPGPAACDIV